MRYLAKVAMLHYLDRALAHVGLVRMERWLGAHQSNRLLLRLNASKSDEIRALQRTIQQMKEGIGHE